MRTVNSLTCHAFCIMLSEREILWNWHLIKGSFQSIFWSVVWYWRSLIWACERCKGGDCSQGCWQSWSAASKNRSITLCNQRMASEWLHCLGQLSLRLHLTLLEMFFHPSGNWLANIRLIDRRPNFKSMSCMRPQCISVKANMLTAVLRWGLQIVSELQQESLIAPIK